MAAIAKALGDPVRLQLVDVLRKHAGKVCVCELVPLFDLSQPTVSHHLKKLRDAGIVGSERPGPVGLLLRHPRRTGGAVRMAELTDPRPPTGDAHAVRPRPRRPAASRPTRPTAAVRRPPGQLRLLGGRATTTPRRSARPSAHATPPRPPRSCRRGSCCGGGYGPERRGSGGLRRRALRRGERDELPDTATMASLGCGNPTAVAELREGETVLDLGSGGGIDVLLSARASARPARPTAST